MPLCLHGFADFANYQLPEIGLSVAHTVALRFFPAIFPHKRVIRTPVGSLPVDVGAGEKLCPGEPTL